MKNLPYFLLCLAIVGLTFACNQSVTTNNPSGEEETPINTVVNTEQVAPLLSGENFRIDVLIDSIKSPRKELTGTVDGVEIVINYGSPAVNGRSIYGNLVPYGKVWRTGANEATRITFSDPVQLGDSEAIVPAGTYSFFTQPTDKENWTIIINKDSDQWGPYDYTPDLDVVRVATTSAPAADKAERMDFSLSEDEIKLHWDDLVIPVNIKRA
ncbi:MAG: DUF2911 domain-containing protein [Bacteroidota bacterium]